MAAQGLDAATPPPAATARRMLDAIHGSWWNVYIGGRFATKIWSPSDVRDYVQHGIRRFMLTYVGEQHGGEWHGILTRERGLQDGREALEQARLFGYSGGVPLCLDIERPTFQTRSAGMVEYARAWCEAVRGGGARPGIYANPDPLVAMAHGGVHADFVWIASWVTRHPEARDPHGRVPGMPADLWSRPGQRAWQYGGAQGGTACTVLGVGVDISVSDLACLAPPPGVVATSSGASAVTGRRPALHRGAHGPVVVRLTHRLSTVRSPDTDRPYLDGPRRRFDAVTEAALKAFQRDHGLPASGTYGRVSARALLTAAKHHKRSRVRPHGAPPANARAAHGAAAPPLPGDGAQVATLPQLVERFQRLEAEAQRAWQRIEAHGSRSRSLLARAEAERRDGLPGIAASLRGIAHHLADLVDVEERELAPAEHPPLPPAPAGNVAEAAPGAVSLPAAGPPAAGSPADAAPTAATSVALPAAPSAPPLADLPTAQLETRIDALDDDLDRSRRERIARYARVEKRLRTEARGTTLEQLLARRSAAARPPAAVRPRRPRASAPGRPAARRPHAARPSGQAPVHDEDASSLQRSLNRFTRQFLEDIPPLRVDGVKGSETNKRVQTAKHYLGYPTDERNAAVTPELVRRLRHPRSLRYANASTLARAARRRRRQRSDAARLGHLPIEGTPKHVIDTIVLPIAASCGIQLTPAQVTARNNAHDEITTAGRRSDHKGPPAYAWAADMSNGSSPTPQMDELARRIARRFDMPWRGSGLLNASSHGYRFQLIYRYAEHFDHVHFGLRLD